MLTSYCFCGAHGWNSLIQGVCQVKWCYAWRQTDRAGFQKSCFFKNQIMSNE